MSEKKRDIIMWDDVNFLFHKSDSIEKIKEDAIKLFESYINAIESPDLFFTSIYSAFRIMHVKNIFLIGLIGIIKRIDALND